MFQDIDFDAEILLRRVADENMRLTEFQTERLTLAFRIVAGYFDPCEPGHYPRMEFRFPFAAKASPAEVVLYLGAWVTAEEKKWDDLTRSMYAGAMMRV